MCLVRSTSIIDVIQYGLDFSKPMGSILDKALSHVNVHIFI